MVFIRVVGGSFDILLLRQCSIRGAPEQHRRFDHGSCFGIVWADQDTEIARGHIAVRMPRQFLIDRLGIHKEAFARYSASCDQCWMGIE